MADQNFRVKNGINVGSAVTITTEEYQVGNTRIHSGGVETRSIVASGVVTATTFDGQVNAGVGTVTTLSGTTATYTTGNIANISGTNLNYTGISTITNLSVTNINSTGIITATQFTTGSGNLEFTTNTISGPSEIIIDPEPVGVGTTSGIVRIRGDLYVDGTQFVVNSTTIELADHNVGIATTVGTNLLLDGAGIGIGSTNIRKTITWNNGLLALSSSENWNIFSGKTYKIGGTDVLTSTTLGSGVVNSSLTSVGTLGQLRVSGVSTFTDGPVFIGAATSTGTASQRLQVTGGAYVSGSVGIGITNPTNSLTIYGTRNDTVPILALLSGNTSIGFNNGAQIAFGYDGLTQYQHFIQTRHNGANSNNAIDFYVCDGTQNNTLTSGSVHTMSLVSGSVGIGTTNPTGRLQVGAGTSTFIVTSSGRVGIGTTNPQGSIHIYRQDTVSGVETHTDFILENPGRGNARFFLKTRDNNRNWEFFADDNDGAFGIYDGVAVARRFSILPAGNILIGTSSTIGTGTTNQTLQVHSGGAYVSGNVGIGTTNPTSTLTVQGNAYITGVTTSTDFDSLSDVNLKTNINQIVDPLEKVMQIRGVTFDWKENNRGSAGVIAQEIEKVLPELVHGEETKTVNYNGLIGLLIECVKKQQEEIEYLKGKVN